MNAEKKQDKDKPTEPKKEKAPVKPKAKEEPPKKEKAPAEPKAKEEPPKKEKAPAEPKAKEEPPAAPQAPKDQKTKKAKIPSAQKRDLQHKKRKIHRKSALSKINTSLKSFSATLQKEDRSLAQKKLSVLYSLLDKGTKTKLIKKNKASKIKSKLTMLLKGKA